MKRPLISRPRVRHPEQGVTMLLVALAMTAIIGMAVLSIDLVTLYLAKEEAQRSADAAALAAARVLSMSGITGDPTNQSGNWGAVCGPSGTATLEAQVVGAQNTVGSRIAPTVAVTYSAGTSGTIGSGTADCTSLSSSAFGVNPMVTVQLTRTGLPNFFSRFWERSGSSISATATAEAFNSSNSGEVGNQTTGTIVPVQPRCVKPLVVPNLDPFNPNAACTTNCQPFVDATDGHIINPGISLNGTNTNGVIGERFLLVPDCRHRTSSSCVLRSNPAQANFFGGTGGSVPNTPPNNLEYLPGETTNSSIAVPSTASAGDLYEQAIAGCDQTTVYHCGVVSSSSSLSSDPNSVDLGANPGANGDTTDGVMALIHEGNANPNGGQPTGQDSLNHGANAWPLPSVYPFQILAGSSSPLVSAGLTSGTQITASNSIASIPIYDPTTSTIASTGTSPVTIIGFLQVFINGVDQYGNVDVTVLNVSGCSNGAGDTVGTPVNGTSPVPIRLITPQ
jgi:Flp pilus assembly protein TadG